MTPRTVISAIPIDMKISDSLQQVSQTPFSHFPLYGKNIDNITDFVLKSDILVYIPRNRGDEKLKTLKRNVLAVPQSISLTCLLERFLKDRQHIAIVVNE
jgi:CBS domain containing-hemolysin-like protein